MFSNIDAPDQWTHTASYRSHTHDILCSTVRILRGSCTSLYSTVSPKQLKREISANLNDKNSPNNDYGVEKKRGYEEGEELMDHETFNSESTVGQKRLRLEEKTNMKVQEKSVVKTKGRVTTDMIEEETLLEMDHEEELNQDSDDSPIFLGLKDSVPSMIAIVSSGADGNMVVYNVESRQETMTFKLVGFPGYYNDVVSVSAHHVCLMVGKRSETD